MLNRAPKNTNESNRARSDFDFLSCFTAFIFIVCWIALGVIIFYTLTALGVTIVPALLVGIIGGAIGTWILGVSGVILEIIGWFY
jgi:hypothetical protein